ncbi:hypothetical protein [Cumulibacter soli]|uniref:hypothetical protein n=1 Tax=Cumulibacter soli TaxID=2546344 RepID=UPI001068AC5C|nr:hypothetical protein [Cumulibacter soli]
MITVPVDEIKDRWPGPFPFDDVYVYKQIEDALTELREHIPDLDALVDSGQIGEESVTKLVAKAVIGALRNSEGFKTESEGDYSYSRFGDGFVWFRDSDIERLLPRKPSATWRWVL